MSLIWEGANFGFFSRHHGQGGEEGIHNELQHEFARDRNIVSDFRQVFLHQLSEHAADFFDGDAAALSSQHGAINVPVGTGMLEHREAERQRPIPRALSRFLSCGFQLAAKPLEAAAEQIILATVVGVKSRAANVGLVDDLLHG